MKMKKTMIKFEEHEGKLFRMLDEPVPLTSDAELPCLVRLISPMGKHNKDLHGFVPGNAGRLTPKIWTEIIDVNDLSDPNRPCDGFMSIQYYRYELIGTHVKEGSNDWALYQMMKGGKVCNPTLAAEKATRLGYDDVERFNTFWYIVGDAVVEGKSNYGTLSVSSWIAAASSTGWEIYKEPKPEPKPLLADAKVGDLCKHRNGDWSQIIDTNGTYIPGQPIITTLKDNKGINRNFCLSGSHFITQFDGEYDIIHTEPLAPEGTADWAWQMLMLGIPVSHPAEGEFQDTDYTKEGFVRCMAKTGWQIYKESKPKYKAGDFVEIINWYSGTTHLAQIDSIDHEIHIGTHRFDISGKSVMERVPQLSIIRKLKPSEVVVDFGSGIKGTIVGCSSVMPIVKVLDGVDWIASIMITALDKETRKLVESLLKAQEEE